MPQSEFKISFLGDRGFFLTRVGRFAASDFVVVDAAGLGAATPEESAEVGLDNMLRLSAELEITDLFTEVGQIV